MTRTFGILLASLFGFARLLPALAGEADMSVVLELTGSQLPEIHDQPVDHIAMMSCSASGCAAIPFQVDEMTRNGRWVLPEGPAPVLDDPPGQFDDNDLLLWRASDAGDAIGDPRWLPPHLAAFAIEVARADGQSRWAYVIACSDVAPRAAAAYVEYQPDLDLMRARRIALGFHEGIPDRLLPVQAEHTDGGNLLDRFKVRAQANFLWGLIQFTRDESDLSTELIGWHRGPIRIIRCQNQRVRLGWGIRSPAFSMCTFFHPDFAELTMGFGLNYRPTYFFSDIVVDVSLDFRELRGWQLAMAGAHDDGPIAPSPTDETTLLPSPAWFALRGPTLTLAQILYVSESLQPARRQLLYRYSDAGHPPESVAGEHPAIGYRLDRWEQVQAGNHGLKTVAFALPAGIDVGEFLAQRARVRVIDVRAIPSVH